MGRRLALGAVASGEIAYANGWHWLPNRLGKSALLEGKMRVL
ncbi:MAG: hypothetical protein AAGC93_07920 [Cyanobacteria bacterium P01_F01_bin.53]